MLNVKKEKKRRNQQGKSSSKPSKLKPNSKLKQSDDFGVIVFPAQCHRFVSERGGKSSSNLYCGLFPWKLSPGTRIAPNPWPNSEGMATPVEPPNGVRIQGKHYYSMWQTLFEIDTKYVPIKPIGRGAYGIVCSSVNRETTEKVAIKKIHNAFENRVDALRTLRELKLLRHLLHKNVIALKDVMMPVQRRSFKDVYLVYELMDTDLHQIIKSSQALTNDHCQYFLFQLLRGLKYLHSANILHRDLKPGNLLINANCDLKICDFGLARTSNGKNQFMTEYVVTRWYRAPELLLCCDNYGTSIDVWSVGCIFAELLGRKPIFPGTECLDQLKLIISILGSQREEGLEFIDNSKAKKYIKSLPYSPGTPFSRLYPNADPLAIDLLQKMLVFDPSKRITVTGALEHPYMSLLYDPSSNPPAQVPIDLDIDEELGEEMIREMMWKEMLHYHPEAVAVNGKVHS
ncbi:hypothetical protein DKX38_002006 [Salix brachista]|uniref:Mitogen-activated protein kinase n=1 Tax=Salix brachista TaxID=2182728 RepID=A0A5N5NN79_9ROSI|nr:hypothetical protein DKX38_002006 [Salix brachista]